MVHQYLLSMERPNVKQIVENSISQSLVSLGNGNGTVFSRLLSENPCSITQMLSHSLTPGFSKSQIHDCSIFLTSPAGTRPFLEAWEFRSRGRSVCMLGLATVDVALQTSRSPRRQLGSPWRGQACNRKLPVGDSCDSHRLRSGTDGDLWHGILDQQLLRSRESDRLLNYATEPLTTRAVPRPRASVLAAQL
ncbi:hypothetical protein J6590_025918 [Homalodisca vitripennis]|nr:hypothetical protein J6590_025918 [Homalodisca vitripennis]